MNYHYQSISVLDVLIGVALFGLVAVVAYSVLLMLTKPNSPSTAYLELRNWARREMVRLSIKSVAVGLAVYFLCPFSGKADRLLLSIAGSLFPVVFLGYGTCYFFRILRNGAKADARNEHQIV
jgi:ABC-type Na+ efflux pump permease subunit